MSSGFVHACAAVVLPVIITGALGFWCKEFYSSEALKKKLAYQVLVAATTACVVGTIALFVSAL